MTQTIPKNISAIALSRWLESEAEIPVLVDVREEEELSIASFPLEVIHLPLSQSSSWIEKIPEKLSKNQPIVVLCHSGIRSFNFATWLLNQAWGYEVWNLEGGIESWSINVDSRVPRY